MELNPIGIVHSPIKETGDMPHRGVPAQVEVYPEFTDGLLGIEGNSHIVVIGFFHKADRTLLRADRFSSGSKQRGIFGIRSSSRPNPLGLSTARLLRRDGNILHVESLDFIDGTPVVDIKRYSPGWDSIFSARSSRDLSAINDRSPKHLTDDMMTEAANFHGERCLGTALAVRIMGHAMETWQTCQKEAGVLLHVGADGCIADGLQAVSGASLGNGRLKVPGGRTYRLTFRDMGLAYYPQEIEGMSPDEALAADLADLFVIRDEVPTHAAYVAEKAAANRSVDPALMHKVSESLVQGRLPCAVAFRIADEMGVHVSLVGRAADLVRAKIALCQLGCFR